jgi:hypothetical protein
MAELQAAVSLTQDQKPVVASALARWQETHRTIAASQGDAGPGRHRRQGSEGDGPGYGPHGPGGFQAPLLTFIAECSGALTDQQFDQLVEFLAARIALRAENGDANRARWMPPSSRLPRSSVSTRPRPKRSTRP